MRYLSLAVALLPALASAAPQFRATSTETAVVLVELYTSEGCSSCPPADRWLRGLRADPRLWHEFVPVAFHVDYWDDLGWPDRYAAPAYGARQRAYRSAGAVRSVYTPGFVVHGTEWRGWFSRERLPRTDHGRPGVLAAELLDDGLHAQFSPIAASSAPLELHVAVLGFDLSSAVARGENAGRTLAHDFAVMGYASAPFALERGRYRGTVPLAAERFPASARALAVWVSRRGDPRPLQALGGWLGPPPPEPSPDTSRSR